MQSQTRFRCHNNECKQTVGQEGDFCTECERKIREVESALDGDQEEQEIIPGIWSRTLS